MSTRPMRIGSPQPTVERPHLQPSCSTERLVRPETGPAGSKSPLRLQEAKSTRGYRNAQFFQTARADHPQAVLSPKKELGRTVVGKKPTGSRNAKAKAVMSARGKKDHVASPSRDSRKQFELNAQKISGSSKSAATNVSSSIIKRRGQPLQHIKYSSSNNNM